MSSYQPGIPTGSVNLDVDYLNIQGNFQQLDTSFGVDHIPFSQTAQNGYHTAIHLNPVSTTATNPPNNQPVDPTSYTATPGIGQVLSAQIDDGINPDEALYFLTGGNRLLQLTRNFVPVAATNGYTFLPGGLIMQWGLQALTNSSSQTGNVLFASSNINFPTNCFNISVSLISKVGGTSSSDNTLAVRSGSVTKLQFTYDYNGQGGSYTGFFWTAIGI